MLSRYTCCFCEGRPPEPAGIVRHERRILVTEAAHVDSEVCVTGPSWSAIDVVRGKREILTGGLSRKTATLLTEGYYAVRARDSFRDFLRQSIIVAVIVLPVLLGFVFDRASGDWGKSIQELLDFTAKVKKELPEHAESLSAREREEQKYLLELVEGTNPILLAALFISFVALLAILFLLTLAVILLYLFFGLYMVDRSLIVGDKPAV